MWLTDKLGGLRFGLLSPSAEMRSCIFLLLLASYLSGIASGNAYSYLGGENESYLCTRNGDEYKVDKPSNEGSCLQYCKKYDAFVFCLPEQHVQPCASDCLRSAHDIFVLLPVDHLYALQRTSKRLRNKMAVSSAHLIRFVLQHSGAGGNHDRVRQNGAATQKMQRTR